MEVGRSLIDMWRWPLERKMVLAKIVEDLKAKV
jgi:hypothetical protein